MTARIETVMLEDGVEIVRLITNDANIVVPNSVHGVPVVSLGEGFLRDSHGPGNRNLVIPGSVVRASPDALTSTSGLRAINYMGDFETFNTFKWVGSTDCQVNCGDGFSFTFLTGYTMAFPDFDNELLASHQRIYEETVMSRLTNPINLTDENREKYVKYMKSRTVPMAEHAILDNDMNTLRTILDTGMLEESDLKGLLESSVRSGRTTSTSVIMTAIQVLHYKS
jgi:hypothetical protein